MNTNDKNESAIKQILKEAYEEIEPPDSWQALRARINHRIEGEKFIAGRATGSVILWRRLALGMAACFLITAGILLYFLWINYGRQGYQQRQITLANNLLSRAEIDHLRFAFSQVRQLFGQQSQWIMVGSGDSTQMGVADGIVSGADRRKVIVVRLAVNLDSMGSQRQYFDIVTFSNQESNFQLPIAGAYAMDISLKPILKNDGRIEVEISAKANGTSRANSISTILDDRFTSLVRMRANGNWVNIDGTGQSVPKI